MDFRDALSADLPAPRDDEPDSLRDDILDELADHLACAYRRELLRGADPRPARQRVLERFGDPAAVALPALARCDERQDHDPAHSCDLLHLAHAVSLSHGGALVDAGRSLTADGSAGTSPVRRPRCTAPRRPRQQMLQQLKDDVEGRGVTQVAGLDPGHVQAHRGDARRAAGRDIEVRLGRGEGGSVKPEAIRRQSDEKGLVDLGVVQPGDWEYRLAFQSRPRRPTWTATGTLNVLLGTRIEKSIVCPKASPGPVAVRPRVEWPPDLANKKLLVSAQFGHEGMTYQAPLRWTAGGFIWDVLLGPEPDPVDALQAAACPSGNLAAGHWSSTRQLRSLLMALS